MTQGSTHGVPIDTDGTLSANSDQLVASQKATKTYADGVGATKQPLDSDLTTIAALAPAASQVIQYDGSAWANQSLRDGRLPTGAIAATYDRFNSYNNTIPSQASKTLRLVAITLPKGVTITSISFHSAGTALNTGVHQFFGIYDSSLNLLRGSNDDTNTAWAGTTLKTLNLTSTFVTTYAGLHYLACLVEATTVPTFLGSDSAQGATRIMAPALTGTSTTNVSALPNPAAAIAALNYPPFAFVS